MQKEGITFQPIGIIYSPFSELESMPIQPTSEASGPGTVEIFGQFAEGLADLEGFSHIILIYHLHEVRDTALTVTPFLDVVERGVFATRAPSRPNPIGMSVVNLLRVEELVLHVENLDVLDKTPLLDIKPYIPEFDYLPEVKIGWLEKNKAEIKSTLSDARFK